MYTVALDGRKIRINLKVDDVFFDIKLKEQYSVKEYVKELDPNSYEVITRQPFDSSKTFNFLHLYYNNHKTRKLVLDKLDEKENKLWEELNNINLIRQRKKKDESDKIIIMKKEDLDNEENKIKKCLQQF